MSGTAMVVWIVAISIFGGVLTRYLKGKERGVDYDLDKLAEALGLSDGSYTKKNMQPYLDRIDKLEERVKVLERIATDKGRNLADEIDNL